MELSHWIYVSKCCLDPAIADQAVRDIVAVSRPRNVALGVTGSLLFVDSMFAQYLDGPAEGLATVRRSIERDERHTEVTTVGDGPVAARRFAGWSLTYSGPSLFVSRTIARQFSTVGPSGVEGDRLLWLMTEFAASDQPMRAAAKS